MGLISSISEDWRMLVALTAVVLVAYPLYTAVYNVYFHPLTKFPGPKLWAISRLPYISAMIKGNLVRKELEFHKRYGQMVRIGPDEISITTSDAYEDMHANRPGHEIPGKHPMWYQSNGQADNLILTTSPEAHHRMRDLLKGSFSESALRTQSPMIETYADLFIQQLRTQARAAGTQGAKIDVVDWFTFFTTDIMGDLALGESFHCLRDSGYHPWVQNLYKFFEGMNLATATRFYPLLDSLVQRLLPQKILDAVEAHVTFVNSRVEARLANTTSTRPDFMSAFMRDNANFQNMSLAELQSSFQLIIVAGSETTATTLAGCLNYLLRPEYSSVLSAVQSEIRTRFPREQDISVASLSPAALPYTTATLHEALRLCNPIPGGLYRRTPPAGTVVSGTHIPGNTSVAIRPFCIARDPDTFADPETFAPERWLADPPGKYKGDKLGASQPFSVGSYNCLGKPLAWAELRICLVRFLWAFEVRRESEWEWDEQDMLVMVHKRGFEVGVREWEGGVRKG